MCRDGVDQFCELSASYGTKPGQSPLRPWGTLALQVPDFSKSGTGTGESPRFRTNRGRGRGSVPAPGQIGDGDGDGDSDGDGDRVVRALSCRLPAHRWRVGDQRHRWGRVQDALPCTRPEEAPGADVLPLLVLDVLVLVVRSMWRRADVCRAACRCMRAGWAGRARRMIVRALRATAPASSAGSRCPLK